MSLWLFKTDPDTYSWDDLSRAKRETWDGVSNNLALKQLRNVKRGDKIFIYHTGAEKAVVGTARTLSDAYPDPADKSGKLTVVDLKPVKRLPRLVTLATIKGNKKLSDWELVRFPRLSIMPVSKVQWEEIIKLSQRKDAVTV